VCSYVLAVSHRRVSWAACDAGPCTTHASALRQRRGESVPLANASRADEDDEHPGDVLIAADSIRRFSEPVLQPIARAFDLERYAGRNRRIIPALAAIVVRPSPQHFLRE